MFSQIYHTRPFLMSIMMLSLACTPDMKDSYCDSPTCAQLEIYKIGTAASSFPLRVSASNPPPGDSACFTKTTGIMWQAASIPLKIDIDSSTIANNGLPLQTTASRTMHDSRCVTNVHVDNAEEVNKYIRNSRIIFQMARFELELNISGNLQDFSVTVPADPSISQYRDTLIFSSNGQSDIPLRPSIMRLPLEPTGGIVENFSIGLISVYTSEGRNIDENFNLRTARTALTLLNTSVSLNDVRLIRN